jgi:hypothetical protein
MLDVLFAITPIFLAFAYRARGGAIALNSTTLARVLFWGIPVGLACGLVAYAWHLPIYLGIAGAVMAFSGACIGHASEQGNTVESFEGMSYITTMMLLLLLLPFYIYFGWQAGRGELGQWDHLQGFVGASLFGFLGGIGYLLGYKMNRPFTLFGVSWCVPGDVSWGEFFTGALAFGLPLSVLGLFA